MLFEAVPADVDELVVGEPGQVALENARRKARAVSGDLVLGADTVVALGDRVIPKPPDAAAAAAALSALSGRRHRVLGGICLREGDEESVAVEETEVTFRRLAEADVRWYVDSGEWEGKAGGYAIQGRGAALVERIAGDYSNVVGLPVAALLRLRPGLLTGERRP